MILLIVVTPSILKYKTGYFVTPLPTSLFLLLFEPSNYSVREVSSSYQSLL